jgi:hypothetical protein
VKISSYKFWVLGFEFRVLDFGFWVLGFGFWVLSIVRVEGLKLSF